MSMPDCSIYALKLPASLLFYVETTLIINRTAKGKLICLNIKNQDTKQGCMLILVAVSAVISRLIGNIMKQIKQLGVDINKILTYNQ